ncbi:MAG: universal stress protein [Thermoanaerobaculaceae bacterium]|nr:universal stress protein [Thermoanaerobaculaceae bacterium]
MFSKILVPVDFTEPVRAPLKMALELARLSHGSVVLLAVVDDSFPNPDILSFQMPWADYYRHLRDAAQEKLEELKRKVGGGSEVEVCVVRGHPARRIAEFAAQEGCDLIVMATHGASGLHHALVGSVTRKVLHLADRPVLVVRLAAGDEKA